MPSTLDVFERDLRELIGEPTTLRPFVCDGSPLDCEAFIVGINAATPMKADFWGFWTSGRGFDRARWFEAYCRERQERPLKPGRTRRNRVSATRTRIDCALDGAAPVRCLETNIYAFPTEAAAELTAANRSTAVFDFLLDRIQPKVILAHGEPAVTHLQGMRGPWRLFGVPHFASRTTGWSKDRAREVGARIKDQVAGG